MDGQSKTINTVNTVNTVKLSVLPMYDIFKSNIFKIYAPNPEKLTKMTVSINKQINCQRNSGPGILDTEQETLPR